MSVLDERELTERLSGVLDAITPSPAPVGAALRNGKIIRARRNITLTAGLAVAAGFVVAMPALLHQPGRPEATPVRPTVMVRQLCPDARHVVPGPVHQAELAAGPAGGFAAELVAGRAGELPAAELVARRCAWLMP
jgi:hypothetical protein